MKFKRNFENVICNLPKSIKKNAAFNETYERETEKKKSLKQFWIEYYSLLSSEFHYDVNKVIEMLGKERYEKIVWIFSKEGKSDEERYREIIPLLRDVDDSQRFRFADYIGLWLTEAGFQLSGFNNSLDVFRYNYNIFAFYKCFKWVSRAYMRHDENMWIYLPDAWPDNYNKLVFKIYNRLKNEFNFMNKEFTCMINCDIRYETRWIVEKNIETEKYLDIEELELSEREEETGDESKGKDENKGDESKEKLVYILSIIIDGKECYSINLNPDKKEENQVCMVLKDNLDKIESDKMKSYVETYVSKMNGIIMKNNFSTVIHPLFQLRIALNDKIPGILKGKGNASSLGVRLKYLGFLRQGLGQYESFVIEKKSRFYLTYILLQGILKSELLNNTEVNQIGKYRKAGVNIIQKHLNQMYQDKIVKGVNTSEAKNFEIADEVPDDTIPLNIIKKLLADISEDFEWKKDGEMKCEMPSRKSQLILIMIYLISAIHSVNVSMLVAKEVFEELGLLHTCKEEYIEKQLMEIDNMLYGWVRIFNTNYDLWLEMMVYMHSYNVQDDRVKYLGNDNVFFKGTMLEKMDTVMQSAYEGRMEKAVLQVPNAEELTGKIFSKDSECTEQKVYRIINDFIIHECYSEKFDKIMKKKIF